MSGPWLRRATISAGVFTALLLATWFAVACFVAGALNSKAFDVDHSRPHLSLSVLSVTDETIVIDGQGAGEEDDWNRDGEFGLEGENGFGRIGSVLSRVDGTVEREFHIQRGTIEPGDAVRVEGFTWQGRPDETLGLADEQVTFDSELGPLGGWLVPGSLDSWVIFVHGKGATPDEALRVLPVVHALGFPAMAITYRNDEGVPPDPSEKYGYGETEWRDLEAAIDFVESRGASSVILYGYSMGGSIILSLIRHSDEADTIEAVVLEAPMLDLRSAVRHQASGRGLPGLLISTGMWVAGWRYGIDWDEFDYRAEAQDLEIPVLLLHGDGDSDIPIRDSREAAARNPKHVRLIEFSGAGHVRSWNLHREQYEEAVRGFLESLASE